MTDTELAELLREEYFHGTHQSSGAWVRVAKLARELLEDKPKVGATYIHLLPGQHGGFLVETHTVSAMDVVVL